MGGEHFAIDPYRPSVRETATLPEHSHRGPDRVQPRVWTVFTMALIAFLAAIGVELSIAGGLILYLLSRGTSPTEAASELAENIMHPPVFLAMLVASQLVFAACALFPAWKSPIAIRTRLALAPPTISTWGYLLCMLGSLLPLSFGVAAAYLVATVIPADESIATLYTRMNTAWGILFIVLIGIVPGTMEELFFRGYVQRRLVDRWGPLAGILVTSIIFAVFHVTPHAFALALIMGLWLGAIAWRTGSIWPGVCCHAFVNSGWNVWQVGQRIWGLPTEFSLAQILGIELVFALLFIAAVVVLVRRVPTVPVAVPGG